MRNHVLVLTTSAVILACGVAASAQAPSAQSPSAQQSPATQPTPGGPMMQQQDQMIRERLRERANVPKRKIAIRTATIIAAE
jgi:hypothetical protein